MQRRHLAVYASQLEEKTENQEDPLGGEFALIRNQVSRMVAYVGPRAQTYSRPACDITELQGSAVAAVATAPESQSHGSGLTRNHFGNRTAGLHNPQFPPLAVPKPEPQQFGEVEREGAEYDYYLHSRKRSKLYDPSPPSVLQVRNGLHNCVVIGHLFP